MFTRLPTILVSLAACMACSSEDGSSNGVNSTSTGGATSQIGMTPGGGMGSTQRVSGVATSTSPTATASGGATGLSGTAKIGAGGNAPVGTNTSPAGGKAPVASGGAGGGQLPTTSTGPGTANGGSSGPTGPGISAANAVVAMGKGVNIGQTFESTQHARTLAAVSAKIDAYYAKGFRNVRIPITWTEPVGGDLLVNSATVGDVNLSHERLAVIKQVVDYALSKSGLYVVINAHHETGLKTNNRANVLERLWGDIAGIFAGKDYRLMYEILNEPHLSDTNNSAMPAADLRAMVKLAYAKIRAADPNRIVIIGGNQWFAANEMAKVWTSLEGVGNGTDPYVMATFHHYNPWTFCGTDNQEDYADEWVDTDVSSPMETMLSWAKSKGGSMPVYIGEWGVGWGSALSTMDCNNVRSWYQKLSSTASTKGIATSLWDDGGWFKVWDISAKNWNNNLADCITGTCAWNGTERFNAACKK